MKKLVIIVGSKSDLAQCKKGFNYLLSNSDKISVEKVYIASQHRHTLKVQETLTGLAKSVNPPDAIIVGAGWASHLVGCCDAFLRYTLKNDTIPVIGVAFADLNEKSTFAEKERHNKAAILSITEVPGAQVIFKDDIIPFIGSMGFYNACQLACLGCIDYAGKFPKIILKEPPLTMELSLTEAIEMAT